MTKTINKVINFLSARLMPINTKTPTANRGLSQTKKNFFLKSLWLFSVFHIFFAGIHFDERTDFEIVSHFVLLILRE